MARTTLAGMAPRFVEVSPPDEARVAEVVLEAPGAGGVRSSRPLDDAVGEALSPI